MRDITGRETGLSLRARLEKASFRERRVNEAAVAADASRARHLGCRVPVRFPPLQRLQFAVTIHAMNCGFYSFVAHMD